MQAGLPPNANALAGLVDRRIERVALERMNEEPVLALQGPRAVGKTTLLKGLARARNASVIDLDDLATREAVADDPATFVSGSAPVLIDEYQHVPVVLDAIKAELNKDSSPGRFVITGSTRYDALPMAARTLTGRLHLLTVLPLAQVELARDRGELLRMLFDDPLALVTSKASSTSREEYAERIVAGGFPPALQRATRAARGRWFDDYLWLCLERDAAELARIQMRSALPELLARLAAQTGQVLNVTAAGASAGLGKRTADNYMKLLEALFLIERLPAWGRTLRARAARLPKLHIVDTGLAARLLGLTPERLLRRDVAALQQFGHLLETFVVGEVRKQASWLEGIFGLGHWRTHDGAELDLVIERDDGSVVGIEVKAASRVTRKDTAPLRVIRDALGEAFASGAVLYTGTHSYTAEDRIHVLPVDRLWRSP